MSRQTVKIDRRNFLRLTAASGGALVLAACGGTAAPAPAPTSLPPTAPPAPTSPPAAPAEAGGEVEVLVKDVLDYALESDAWPGAFGSVTFRLHEGRVGGEPIYFIRTDASDPTYAEQEGLVFVPLLNTANGADVANRLYQFGDGRPPVMHVGPADPTFSSLFQLVSVTGGGDLALDSAAAIEAAAAGGQITLEEQLIFVNFPVIKWPEGELSVDEALDAYLGGGQLIQPPDLSAMTVTMKLHQCFPGSRYIVTDTSTAEMAPMMSIPSSVPNQKLMERGGTDEIWVFGNGIPGSGVMGFQPAIFDNRAGEPAWSPFWNHFTVTWKDESQARVLRSSAEIREAIDSGELELFNGVPDSHPNGFVVNCPVPILAPNTFEG